MLCEFFREPGGLCAGVLKPQAEVSSVLWSLSQSCSFWEALAEWEHEQGGHCSCIHVALSYPICHLLDIKRFALILTVTLLVIPVYAK